LATEKENLEKEMSNLETVNKNLLEVQSNEKNMKPVAIKATPTKIETSPNMKISEVAKMDNRLMKSHIQDSNQPSRTKVPIHFEEEQVPKELRTAYVSNLNRRLQNTQIYGLFSQFGRIDNCFIMNDTKTGASKGIAFVEFADAGDCEQAIKYLKDVKFGGQPINVSLAKRKHIQSGSEFSKGDMAGLQSIPLANNYLMPQSVDPTKRLFSQLAQAQAQAQAQPNINIYSKLSNFADSNQQRQALGAYSALGEINNLTNDEIALLHQLLVSNNAGGNQVQSTSPYYNTGLNTGVSPSLLALQDLFHN